MCIWRLPQKTKINVFEKIFFTAQAHLGKLHLKKKMLLFASEVKQCGSPKLHIFTDFRAPCNTKFMRKWRRINFDP